MSFYIRATNKKQNMQAKFLQARGEAQKKSHAHVIIGFIRTLRPK